MDTYKENPTNPNGIISLRQFTSTVDEILSTNKFTNKVFSIVILEFSVKDNSFSSQIATFIEFISRAINANIKQEEDCCTLNDEGKFIIFLSEPGINLAVLTVSKIVNEIKLGLKNYIEVDIAISQYPQDGETCSELIERSLYSIARTKEKIKRASGNDDDSVKQLQDKLDSVDTSTRSGRLVKQITMLLNHICSYDSYLGEHSCLVTAGSIIFAKELGLSWADVERIAVSALLHDIGYTVFPKSIFRSFVPAAN